MKNIYIGDIHGLNTWEQIVDEHQDADNIVFVGDYFDSYNLQGIIQLHNAKRIIEFKEFQELDPSKKVHLLIGNHDIHYYTGNASGGATAGYQPGMRPAFEGFLLENKQHFKMCALIGNRLCTHAGVSETFLSDTGYYAHDMEIDDYLNELFHHKMNEFIFTAGYDRGYHIVDSYGGDEWQSPIWIRPLQLQRANKKSDIKKKYVQIVGHTKQLKIDIKGKSTGGRYYYIDTLPVGEYLIEIDNEFLVGKICQ